MPGIWTDALAWIGLLLVLGCTEDVSLDIYLVRSPDVDEDPLIPDVTTDVRMRISGPGMKPVEIVAPYKPGGSAVMPNVPLGKDRIVTVEGLKSDGLVLSRGRSLPIDINEDTNKVTLLIARVGRFSYTPGNGLGTARFAHVAAAAETGALFIAGGASDGSPDFPLSPVSTIEAFNPTDGSVHPMPCGNDCGASPGMYGNLLSLNGGLLSVSGLGEDGPAVDATFIEPKSETVAPAAMNLSQRYSATGISTDEFGIVAGGLDADGNAVDSVEVISSSFEVAALSLTEPRWAMAGSGTPTMGVFFGGFDADENVTNDIFLVDPASSSVQHLIADIEARAFARAVTLLDNRVLIIGGLTEEGSASSSIDLIDPAQQIVCPIGALKTGVWHTAAALLPDGRVLVVGGLMGSLSGTPIASAVILDPRYIEITEGCSENSGMFFSTDIPPSGIARYLSAAVPTQNGNIAVIGGLSISGEAIKQIEIFVPEE